MTRSLLLWVIGLAVWFGIGCGSAVAPPVTPLERLQGDPIFADGFHVGTDVADITPPLHLSLFGHGPESRVATGVRLRLRCQTFVVASAREVVALVPCDLQSSSATLHLRIARNLRELGIPIPAQRLFVMATHTHAGPAHYFEARHFSGPFSSSLPGYDDAVVELLARRISSSIVRAYTTMGPACIGWSFKPLKGFTFNRAYVPFLRNDIPLPGADATHQYMFDALQRSRQADVMAGSADDSPTGAEQAVDHDLYVLRFDRRAPGATSCNTGLPLGVLAVYGMHPTGIPNTNEVYHGDIFGFATRTAAACLGNGKRSPVTGRIELSSDPSACEDTGGSRGSLVSVGLANGVEGDVSPKLEIQSIPNARRLGRRLGIEIAKTAAGITQFEASGRLEAAYWQLWFPNAWADREGTKKLCETPDLGMPVAGGAHDGPTRLRVLPEANSGHRLRDFGDRCQREKLAVRFGVTPHEQDFPRSGSIALLRIGPALLGTLPLEPTTATGIRIRQALVPWLGTTSIGLVGLTNQYLDYVTTEEEYPFQYYEGASNLYGPHTSRFLIGQFQCLAEWLVTKRTPACARRYAAVSEEPIPIDGLREFDLQPEPRVSRLPAEEDIGALHVEQPAVHPSFPDGESGWEIQFPRLPLTFIADREKFRVEILAGGHGNTIVDDDRGSSLEVSEIGLGDEWRVRWSPNLEARGSADRCHREYRIAVRGRYRFESKTFRVTCPGRNAP